MAERVPLLTAEEWKRAPFGQWIAHSGTLDASRQLACWLVQGGRLWLDSSGPASGKSHLIHQLTAESPSLALLQPATIAGVTATARVARCLELLAGKSHWVFDLDAGACDAITGEALFHLLEQARQCKAHVLVSWHCEDAQLSPPELASRLRTFDKVWLKPPASDEELRAVLLSVAHNWRWDVPEGVLSTMLTHTERTLAHQLAVLRQLEVASRPERVRATQRWVKDKLGTS